MKADSAICRIRSGSGFSMIYICTMMHGGIKGITTVSIQGCMVQLLLMVQVSCTMVSRGYGFVPLT